MSKLNKIKLSGTSYDIEDVNATKTVELTQAQYDALVSGGTVDQNTFYVITDASAADLSQYYTSAQTESAITQAVSGKQDTLVSGTNIKTINNESILGEGNITIQGGGGGIDSGTVQTMIDESISGKVDTSAVTSSVTSASTNSEIPTAKAVNDKLGGTSIVRLTQAQYDALTTKDPNTVYYITDATPINMSDYQPLLSAGTNITITDNVISAQLEGGGVSRADVEDMISAATSGYVESSAITEEITAAVSGKQDTLVSGTNIKTINNESILGSGNIDIQGGGGKAVSGGTNISITTGETADTINCTLPIVDLGNNNIVFTDKGYGSGSHTLSFGDGASTPSIYSMSLGNFTNARGNYSVAIGYGCITNAKNSNAFGYYTVTNNDKETAQGVYNNSVSGSSTFGDSGNTLFSVGNGTANNARHNAFEIRQNGDIYISSGGTDIKLQDNLGGGSSITVVQTTGTSTTDVMSQDAVTSAIPTVTNQITSGSTDVITSGAVYDAIGDIESLLSNI